jgi:hypothetical protein
MNTDSAPPIRQAAFQIPLPSIVTCIFAISLALLLLSWFLIGGTDREKVSVSLVREQDTDLKPKE